MYFHTQNLETFNFYALSSGDISVSEKGDSDKDSVVSDYFHTSSGKIVQPPGK
jgi:hypothetical protein